MAVQQIGKVRTPLLAFQPLEESIHPLEEIHLVFCHRAKHLYFRELEHQNPGDEQGSYQKFLSLGNVEYDAKHHCLGDNYQHEIHAPLPPSQVL
jgi:hypothetical protein